MHALYILTLAFLYYYVHSYNMRKWILLIQYVDSVDAILSVFLALYVGEIPIFDL